MAFFFGRPFPDDMEYRFQQVMARACMTGTLHRHHEPGCRCELIYAPERLAVALGYAAQAWTGSRLN